MTDLRDSLQSELGSAYAIERELGGGGMARVFVAEDRALGRRVVVRLLAPDLVADISVERFQREIRTAASLQQANIVPLLSAGQANGVPYYTMPFIDGESLRHRLATSGKLPVGEVVRVLTDVARALAYAHERGIVHRDIKPDNVLLSRGTAVVTDFGIAKALAAARTRGDGAASTLTQLGTSIGTPAYMAPEQVEGDPAIDGRADLYALGCVAYELLAGVSPFDRPTAQRSMLAHLADVPAPIESVRADVPPSLASLIAQCLEKDAGLRPRSADDVLRSLEMMTEPSGSRVLDSRATNALSAWRAIAVYVASLLGVAAAARAAVVGLGLPDWVLPGAIGVMLLGLPMVLATAFAARLRPHLSWRRTALGGIAACVTFAAVVTVFMWLRANGVGRFGSLLASGQLAADDQILLADFKVSGGDQSLGPATSALMNASLSRSPSIHLVPASTIAGALQRMQRPLDTHLDAEVAREIARREGIKGLALCDLTPLGSSSYVVSARLVAAASGDVLWSGSETIRSTTDLADGVDRLVRSLRGKVGESFKTVRADPPLDRVTTSSLDALRLYSEGTHAWYIEGDGAKAMRDFDEAVAIDSTFASAWAKLYVVYNQTRVRLNQRAAVLERAYRFRDRMTEPERLQMLGYYYEGSAHRDFDKRQLLSAELAQRFPTWPSTLRNYANVLYQLRDFAASESVFVRTIQVMPYERNAYWNKVLTEIALGRLAQARQSIAVARAHTTDPPVYEAFHASRVLYNAGNIDSARILLDSALRLGRAEHVSAPSLNSMTGSPESDRVAMALRDGRINEYVDLQRAFRAAFNGRIRPEISDSLDIFSVLTVQLERPEEAVRRLDALLQRTPLASTPRYQYAYLDVAVMYGQAGRADRASAVLRDYDATVTDTATRRLDLLSRRYAEGWLAMASGKPQEALARFREANAPALTFSCTYCLDDAIGLAFERTSMPDSAIATYVHYLQATRDTKLAVDAFSRAWILRRLAELSESRGDLRAAIDYYGQFAEQWKKADPELQPQVAEARRKIAILEKQLGKT